MVEYALKIALIAGIAIAALTTVGIVVANRLCDSAGKVSTATQLGQQHPGYYDLSQNKCCVAVGDIFGSPIYHCE